MTKCLDHLLADLAAHVAVVQGNWLDAKYPGFHAFVLANGRAYTPQPLPQRYKRGPVQACFENAFRIAERHGLIYVEGFATSEAAACIPVLHAWCVEPGKYLVIDTTWAKIGAVYFGVPINLEYRKCQGGTVLDHWQAGYPILQRSTDEAEWTYRCYDLG